MKKLLILFLLFTGILTYRANAQAITDTASLRNVINTQIVPNASGGITATKLNNILNGIATLMKAYAVDSAWWQAPDTLVLGRRGGFASYKVRIAISPAGAETDPTVNAAAKAITSGDVANWNSKQAALSGSSTVSIVANVVSAQNTTALWNANQLQGRSVSSTAPTTNQVLGWNGSTWIPMDQTGGGGGADGNNYPTGITYNSGTGNLTMTRNGLGNLVASLDGRFVQSISRSRDSVFVNYGSGPVFQYKDSVGTGGGGGITALTGDVTASGSGSVAATIANGVVGISKLSATGTPNADKFLRGDNVWDSVDYAKLKNTPQVNPGSYIAPNNNFNPGFLVVASAIVRPSSTYAHGTPIVWEILDNTTSHNSSFIDSAYGNGGTGQLTLRYPTVKNVLNLTVTSDESFAGQMIFQGPTIGTTTANVSVYRPSPPISVTLTGAGTTTWTKSNTYGSTSNWDVTTYNTVDGTTSFNVTTTTGTEYDAIGIIYEGQNGYGIERFYSGLGAYNVKFALVDAFGNPITAAPTSGDKVRIIGVGTSAQQVNMATYTASITSWLASIYNFLVTGLFEAWMVAAPVSSTSAQVRWQSYPSATQYKIYRSTTLYGTKTLIYTGTDFRFEDTGLSANTKYYYHMYATISAVDTFITSFTTNTYQ